MEQTTKPRINKALEGFDTLPDSAFVRVATVSALRNCSGATTWRHVKLGLLPAPKKLSAGITGWNVGELRACLAAAGVTSVTGE
jgi:predicted DNA-binding transcriptional regulator AlpA